MSLARFIIATAGISLLVVTLPILANAAFNLTEAGKLGLPENLIGIIGTIIKTALVLVAVVALAYLVYGGFLYITSGGDEKRVDQAKHTITYAVIGIITIGLSYAIIAFAIGAVGGGRGTGGPGSPINGGRVINQ